VRCDLTNGAASNDRSASVRRLVALAYILAISIPPLGLILGITLSLRSGRQYAKHGMAIIGLSIIASIVWVVILTSGALTASTTSY
jgi:drug/metabolite transporter superfamily protein YnfA